MISPGTVQSLGLSQCCMKINDKYMPTLTWNKLVDGNGTVADCSWKCEYCAGDRERQNGLCRVLKK